MERTDDSTIFTSWRLEHSSHPSRSTITWEMVGRNQLIKASQRRPWICFTLNIYTYIYIYIPIFCFLSATPETLNIYTCNLLFFFLYIYFLLFFFFVNWSLLWAWIRFLLRLFSVNSCWWRCTVATGENWIALWVCWVGLVGLIIC